MLLVFYPLSRSERRPWAGQCRLSLRERTSPFAERKTTLSPWIDGLDSSLGSREQCNRVVHPVRHRPVVVTRNRGVGVDVSVIGLAPGAPGPVRPLNAELGIGPVNTETGIRSVMEAGMAVNVAAVVTTVP